MIKLKSYILQEADNLNKDFLKIADIKIKSRLIVGTGKYKNLLETAKAVVSPGSDNNATGQTYPYEQLKHPGPFPAGIDVTRRETYLSAGDCERLFGMTAEALAQMPKWKRNNLKKKVGLF